MLDAFSVLPNVDLVVAGTGSQFGYYKEYATENVRFVGFLSRNELSKCLSKVKAVIILSKWYEIFGMIIAEAYASHKPVIVGNVGNIASLDEEGLTGLHFDYDSPRLLKNAVLKFENMDTGTMEANAYRKYKAELTAESNYLLLKNIYNFGDR